MMNKHSFHIVDYSPWPLLNSFNLMNLLVFLVEGFNTGLNNWKLYLFMFLMILSMGLWWRDVSREGSFQGCHTFNVYMGLKLSMLLFILSEVMFFMSFFWGFFHFSLSPEIEIGNSWPPMGITMINPYYVPLLNTLILLSSGVVITFCHYSLLSSKYVLSLFCLLLTIMMGVFFSILQVGEYCWTEFSFNDSVFGSIFFIGTGFHGLHVFIGTLFLIVNFFRMYMNLFSNYHHFSFEAGVWYWHFVDVVWIYLYVFMYWWFF